MRLAWVTDPHLDFLGPDEVAHFCHSVAAHEPDAVVITGDIATARNVAARLRQLGGLLRRPIYFVLGNHDFYHGESMARTRADVASCAADSRWLRWLTQEQALPLTPDVSLIGHDGWADGRFGNYLRSNVLLADYVTIRDLVNPITRLSTMQSLAQAAAEHFLRVLPAALERSERVILATHVPPFREACWYEGQISDDNWLPHFSSRVVGEALIGVMRGHPGQLLVLCGHTHGEGAAQILPNLRVLTASALYGEPDVYRVLDLDDPWDWTDPPLYA